MPNLVNTAPILQECGIPELGGLPVLRDVIAWSRARGATNDQLALLKPVRAELSGPLEELIKTPCPCSSKKLRVDTLPT